MARRHGVQFYRGIGNGVLLWSKKVVGGGCPEWEHVDKNGLSMRQGKLPEDLASVGVYLDLNADHRPPPDIPDGIGDSVRYSFVTNLSNNINTVILQR